jgi:serine O-acetyltransferase
VVGVPGRVVRMRGENGVLEHGKLPDPQGQALDDLTNRVAELEAMLRHMIAEHELDHQRKNSA